MTILDNTIKALKTLRESVIFGYMQNIEKVVGNTITKKPTSWNKSLWMNEILLTLR